MILILDKDHESNLNVVTVGESKLVDCLWDEFDEWSACSKTCGSGEKSRSRSKVNEEENGGVPCVGNSIEIEACNTLTCAIDTVESKSVDCLWADFDEWSSCSKTCGSGEKSRSRSKVNEEENGGAPCFGNAIETEACNTLICPVDTDESKSVDCLWAEFDEWSSCSKTCGSGEKSRRRSKVHEEENGGVPCVGNPIQTEACSTVACPVDTVESKSVDCLWDEFDEWSSCSKTCGSGEKSRSRLKVNVEENGGVPCVGNAIETEACSTQKCHVDNVVTKAQDHDIKNDENVDLVTSTKDTKDESKQSEVLKNSGIALEGISKATSEKHNGK